MKFVASVHVRTEEGAFGDILKQARSFAITSRGRYVAPSRQAKVNQLRPALPGFRLPGTLPPHKPFEGSTKLPNPSEAPLGVYLRALARPVAPTRRAIPRKGRPSAKVFKSVRQPRREFAEVVKRGQDRAYCRGIEVAEAIRDAGLSGRVVNTKACRLVIQAQNRWLRLSVIQDFLSAKGEA